MHSTGLPDHVSGQSNKTLSRPAHSLSAEQVADELGANLQDGLSTSIATGRCEESGFNELVEDEEVQPARILIAQMANAMTLVLILAMAVSFGIRSWIEGGVIAGVIMINVTIGFIQEFQAAKTMSSLRSLSSPSANVTRDGNTVSIPTREIVPGDIVEVKTGDTIPADLRLLEAVNFETDEALLTGEFLPVHKKAELIFNDGTGPGDRLNIAFSSSAVTKGRATGIVFATGMFTEIGAIAFALRGQKSIGRPVKREKDGTAKPHRYVQAWTLTISDAVSRFLGINTGTPLQKKLARLSILLFGVALICAIIVLAANKFTDYPNLPGSDPTHEIAIYAVATGLSMIPASLTVILTITMAAGTKRMVKRNVIVRRMDAVEALGSITDICSDKTGTLTQGKMVAKKVWIPSQGTYSIGNSSEPFNPTMGSLHFQNLAPRNIDFGESKIKLESLSYEAALHDNSALYEFIKVASLANLATVHKMGDEWKARGDPTEIAIQVFASRFGWNRSQKVEGHNAAWQVLAEFPFDSDVKKMSVICREACSGHVVILVKGAVERTIDSCTTIIGQEYALPVPLDDERRTEILENVHALATLGLRCLALASRNYHGEVKEGDEMNREEMETDLTFCGLIALYDAPRPESKGAVKMCHQAGINVHMLTGDHPGTAQAIAIQVGILPSRMELVSKDVVNSMVMTATDFDSLSANEIDELPVLPLVIARCAPKTKVRMIEALHRRGKFAAMTGDGVNDSPSLKHADVGIAMGQAGSDVAKDASDIILTDDNFSSILNAIEEGRRMFDNIQKFVLHLLAQNVGQACILLVGLVFKDVRDISVYPLSPVEILWVIMVTSSIPDMGLGFEKAAPDIMNRPPVSLKSGIFSPELLIDMVVYGLWIATLCLSAFTLVIWGFGDGNLGSGCNAALAEDCNVVFRARGTTFACMTWLSLLLAWEMLDMKRSFFGMQPGSNRPLTQWMHDVWRNKFLFWAVMIGILTTVPTLYVPIINTDVFLHKGITWEWSIVFVVIVIFLLGIETWKFAKRVFCRWRDRSASTHAELGDIESGVFEAYMRHVNSQLSGSTTAESKV